MWPPALCTSLQTHTEHSNIQKPTSPWRVLVQSCGTEPRLNSELNTNIVLLTRGRTNVWSVRFYNPLMFHFLLHESDQGTVERRSVRLTCLLECLIVWCTNHVSYLSNNVLWPEHCVKLDIRNIISYANYHIELICIFESIQNVRKISCIDDVSFWYQKENHLIMKWIWGNVTSDIRSDTD